MKRYLVVPVLLLGVTVFSLVVVPGQWVPVLFRDELNVIGLSLVPLAMGAAVASAALARTRTEPTGAISVAVASGSAVVLAAIAVALYKLVFDGIGWPDPLQLALGPAFVAVATLSGYAVGRWCRGRPRIVGAAASAVLAAVLGILGAALFAAWLNDAFAPRYDVASQVCEERDGIRYCANPGYEPFIDHWEETTELVLAEVPEEVVARDGLVSQLTREGQRVPGVIAAPGLDWGKGAGLGVAQLAVGLDVANWATGVVSTLVVIDEGDPPGPCTPIGRARSVVAFWLAGQVSPDAAAVVADLGCCADAISGSTFGAPAVSGDWDVAARLLELPHDEVHDILVAHWDELVDPDAPIELVGELFDVEVRDGGSDDALEAGAYCPE